MNRVNNIAACLCISVLWNEDRFYARVFVPTLSPTHSYICCKVITIKELFYSTLACTAMVLGTVVNLLLKCILQCLKAKVGMQDGWNTRWLGMCILIVLGVQ